jgi:hypothetical protein
MSIRPPILAIALGTISLIVAACGSNSARPRAHSAAATIPAVPAPHPPLAHLHILSPRAGGHTGTRVLVRVRLADGGFAGRHAFLYRLDGRRVARAGERIVLRNVHPGRHRLEVSFDNGAHAAAAVRFTVRTPPPRPAPVTETSPGPATPTPTTSAPATPPAGASSTTTASSPMPTTSRPASTPTPTTTSPPSPPPASGIPQGNAGDHDSDNNGGPTDGDGNI